MKDWRQRFFGVMPHARGAAPALMEDGWLPRRAAADAMHITVRELDRRAKEHEIGTRKIGPSARLYRVRDRGEKA